MLFGSQGRVGLAGQGLGGGSKGFGSGGVGGRGIQGFGSGRVGVLFVESWRVDAVCLVLFGGQGRVGLAGQGLGGGPRASVPGGVGGGTGSRTEQISQRVSYFCRL